jgi:putative ABC transport system permease protein
MTRVFDDALWRPRVAGVLVAVFAVIAVALTAVGLYGVLAYTVNSRRGEIGIRLALGDRPQGVQRWIAGESLTLTTAGIAVGLTVASLAVPAIRPFLGDEPLRDPLAIAASIGLLLAVGLLAALAPAQRAARIDPGQMLRSE